MTPSGPAPDSVRGPAVTRLPAVLSGARRAGRGGRATLTSDHVLPYLLVAPAVILVFALTIYPTVYVLLTSFTDWNLMRTVTKTVGAKNYVDLLGDDLALLSTLEEVAERIRTTHCCGLCPHRINAVPGEGNPNARLFLVGEGPGATEDAQGRPFVGPAGQLLDRALAEAGIDRSTVYVTNVVKHFSWEERGKWRIHKKPKPHQIEACRPWLAAELAVLSPRCTTSR
jgi:hypothetical protein